MQWFFRDLFFSGVSKCCCSTSGHRPTIFWLDKPQKVVPELLQTYTLQFRFAFNVLPQLPTRVIKLSKSKMTQTGSAFGSWFVNRPCIIRPAIFPSTRWLSNVFPSPLRHWWLATLPNHPAQRRAPIRHRIADSSLFGNWCGRKNRFALPFYAIVGYGEKLSRFGT